ncbi:MAG: YhjD/YihY/BrkB family envelope integrity protein [Phycisphaerae bacterium]
MAAETSPPPPKGQPMTYWQILKSTFNEWLEDRASRLAAAVAYYAIFSIAPLLMIAIAVLGLIFGRKAAANQIEPQLAQYVGAGAAKFVQELVAKASYSPSLSFAGIISLLLLLYAATNLFVSLQDALNTIFDVEPKPNRGITGIIKDRALSFIMILFIGAFILASIIFSTAVSAIGPHLPGNSFFHSALLYVGGFLLSTLLFTGVFATMFKMLPDIKIDWKDTLIGAAATSLIFNLARIGLSLYLGRSSTTGPFGAAGSLVLIMLFINYSTQILFLGAEFTQVWARRHGHPIEPSENALSLDPDYTEPATEGQPEGTGSPTAASGATGSRRHYDSVKASPRSSAASQRSTATPQRPSAAPSKVVQKPSKTVPNPSRSAPSPHSKRASNAPDWRSSRPAPSRTNPPEIAQLPNSDHSPHYPPEKFHPPMNQRRGAYVELASAAALLAIPLTWFTFRRGS